MFLKTITKYNDQKLRNVGSGGEIEVRGNKYDNCYDLFSFVRLFFMLFGSFDFFIFQRVKDLIYRTLVAG